MQNWMWLVQKASKPLPWAELKLSYGGGPLQFVDTKCLDTTLIAASLSNFAAVEAQHSCRGFHDASSSSNVQPSRYSQPNKKM